MCNRCQVNSLILVIFCLFVLIVPSFKKQLKSHLFRSTYTISVGGLCLMLVSVCTFFVSFFFQVTLSTNRKHSIKLIYIIIFSGKLQSRIEVFNREQRFPPFFFSRIDQIWHNQMRYLVAFGCCTLHHCQVQGDKFRKKQTRTWSTLERKIVRRDVSKKPRTSARIVAADLDSSGLGVSRNRAVSALHCGGLQGHHPRTPFYSKSSTSKEPCALVWWY